MSPAMITRRILSRPTGSLAQGVWTCPSCTRSSILAQTKAAPIQRQRQQQQQRRSIHHVPPLAYDETFGREGVPGLFSKDGYLLAWTQYQNMLVQKLNELTAGEPIENMTPKNIALTFARDPMNASLFNYASAAHNNHHFFSTLASAPLPLQKVPQLQESLSRTFGSIDTLRYTMLDTAAAMFGPGYVWLVWAKNVGSVGQSSASARMSRQGDWRILTTYLAGTPYSEAGYRQQGIDMASNNANSYQDYLANQHLQTVANTAGSFGPYSAGGQAAAKLPPGGTSVMPVLCVSTWEHSYLLNYGVTGKREYLENWWAAVDWGVVEANTPLDAKTLHQFM